MTDIFQMDMDIRDSIEKIKDWLKEREYLSEEDYGYVRASDGLSSIGFKDIGFKKFEPVHNDRIIYCIDSATSKPLFWTNLSHLVEWSTKFLDNLKKHKAELAVLELLGGNKEVPISLAYAHVNEAESIVQSAINFELALDLQHHETRDSNYAIENFLIEQPVNVHDIVRQVFTCLYSKCCVRLTVKSSQYNAASLTSFLVDLMHTSGASYKEISCYMLDRRESLGSERFSRFVTSSRASKLSTVAVVFGRTDTFAAAQCIIETYFREQYQNLIVLVEESAYELFVKDWQRYFSHALTIGPRVDKRTVVTEELNKKLKVDYSAIDIKAAHKTSGHAINMLRFRNLADLVSLLSNFRKLPYIQLWHDDTLILRDLCNELNCCSQFWLRCMPETHCGPNFAHDLIQFVGEVNSELTQMTYNKLSLQFADDIASLRKLQTAFVKRDLKVRTQVVMHAFIATLTKHKSLKNGLTMGEAVGKLRQFHHRLSSLNHYLEPDCKIETIHKPVGLLIINVILTKACASVVSSSDELEQTIVPNNPNNSSSGTSSSSITSAKFKSILTELIFKNLLLGNAVLLFCAPGTLGAKFTIENDHFLPFKMVHPEVTNLPDMSRLSLNPDNSSSFSVEDHDQLSESSQDPLARLPDSPEKVIKFGSQAKKASSDANLDVSSSLRNKQCPKSVFVIDFTCAMTGDMAEALTLSLGAKQKTYWYPNAIQTHYWEDV